MSTFKTISVAPERNAMAICVSVLFLSIFNLCCNATSVSAQAKTVAANQHKGTNNKNAEKQKQESDIIPRLTSWRQVSYMADKLIDEKKYDEAANMLTSILPRAKSDAPLSLDYALTLCRLSTDFYAMKKYSQALTKVEEATAVLSRNPSSTRQHKIMWRSMVTKSAILLAMRNNIEAEALARKTIAYAIAFPDVAAPRQVKIAYSLLNSSLEAQKKFEEARKTSEIMNRL